MTKPTWRERCRRAVREYPERIVRRYPQAMATRSPDGQGADHCLFMAQELLKPDYLGEIKDDGFKACRWLGWLQNELTHLGVLTLEDSKNDNLNSKHDPQRC